MSANTNQLSRTSSRREASLSPPESSSSSSSKEASPSTQASGSSQEAAKQSSSQEAQKPQDIPAEKENVNLLLQKQSSNLSVGGRGTWPESPRWGSGGSSSSWTVGSGVEEYFGIGNGGRSSPGAPVVMIGNPGTADQWERALFYNEMQKSSTNPVEEFLLVDDHLNQSGKITSK